MSAPHGNAREAGRLAGLREAAELARDLGDGVLLGSGTHDRGQRRMANRIVTRINARLVAAGMEPVEI